MTFEQVKNARVLFRLLTCKGQAFLLVSRDESLRKKMAYSAQGTAVQISIAILVLCFVGLLPFSYCLHPAHNGRKINFLGFHQ